MLHAWLSEALYEAIAENDKTMFWQGNVARYIVASEVILRGQLPLLRPGSGPGQRLRLNLVSEFLLNMTGDVEWPRLDPSKLALIFEGDLIKLFGENAAHRNFELELERLVQAGIFELHTNQIRVLLMNRGEFQRESEPRSADMVLYWAKRSDCNSELVSALHRTLSFAQVEYPWECAKAVAQETLADGRLPGPIYKLLSSLAERDIHDSSQPDVEWGLKRTG